jgi:hypothetical protein
MASTLIEVFKVAICRYDGEGIDEVVGYKSIDGDITDEPTLIQYYSSRQKAGEYIDNSDAEELGYIEVIKPEFVDFEDMNNINIKGV